MLADPVDALTDVAVRLERAGIAYMLTGSVAGYFYGLNRSTADTDIVIDFAVKDVAPLVDAFRDAYFIDELMAEDGAKTGYMFNVMPRGGGKIDFIPLRKEPFEQTKFERRVAHDWHGHALWVATAPDLVLSKLEWSRSSHSHLQFSDIRTIIASGFVDEHDDYFQRWLSTLDLHATLDACRTEGHEA